MRYTTWLTLCAAIAVTLVSLFAFLLFEIVWAVILFLWG